MTPLARAALFERVVQPHMEAGWNLARWLLRNAHDAEDVIQEASLRALQFINTYRGGDERSWFLAIVRNLCRDHHRRAKRAEATSTFESPPETLPSAGPSALEKMETASDIERLRQAIEELPMQYREVLVLREFEGLSYKQITDAVGVPMGTVMSRLARAREKLVELTTSSVDKQEGPA